MGTNPIPAMPVERQTILVVEDNADDQFLLQEAWKMGALENPLAFVQDGEQACDYLAGLCRYADRTRYPAPLFVILDLKLPGKSGLEVLAWMRAKEELKSLPVIVLTASTWPGDVAEAYRLGANSFVIKPSAAQELVDFTAALKGYWLRFNKFVEP